MFKFRFFLPILLALIGHNSFSAGREHEEDLFPSPLTLRPSPADAIQRLGAHELVVEGDSSECFPSQVSLKGFLPSYVYRQGRLGSCTANALARALDARSKITGAPVIGPSRLFIYYGERQLEESRYSDQGASLYSGLQTLKTVGFCSEEVWAYDDGPRKFTQTPSQEAYVEARDHKVLDDLGIAWISGDILKIRAALANDILVVFGMELHQSFHNARQGGKVPMPKGASDRPSGGHAMLFVGYDDAFKNLDGSFGALEFQNSWGKEWGDKGFAYLPYNMVKYISEAWGIQRITGEPESGEGFNHISFKESDYRIPQPKEDAPSDA